MHWTQVKRKEQIKRLTAIIKMYGSLSAIYEKIGKSAFLRLAAYNLGCSERRVEEYLSIMIGALQAEKDLSSSLVVDTTDSPKLGSDL